MNRCAYNGTFLISLPTIWKGQLNSLGSYLDNKRIEYKGMNDTVPENKQYLTITTTKDDNGIDAMSGGMLKR